MRYKIIFKNNLIKRPDEPDIKIIHLMVLNKTNKDIPSDLHMPLSTVQRRVRELLEAGYVKSSVQINFEKFGFKTGLVHVYLKNGNIEELAKKIYNLSQITYVEIHIGNSDILGNVIYKDSKELLNLISTLKKWRKWKE